MECQAGSKDRLPLPNLSEFRVRRENRAGEGEYSSVFFPVVAKEVHIAEVPRAQEPEDLF